MDTVVLTGNTTMLYLLTGRDVDCLSHAPFLADELFGRYAEPEELTLSAAPGPDYTSPMHVGLCRG